MRTQRECAIYEPGSQPWTDKESASALFFSISRNVCCLTHIVYSIFVIVALMNNDRLDDYLIKYHKE